MEKSENSKKERRSKRETKIQRWKETEGKNGEKEKRKEEKRNIRRRKEFH